MTAERIDLTLPDGRLCALHIGPGAWQELPRHLAARPPSAVALVADEQVFALCGERFCALLAGAGHPPLVHLLPPGEASKSFARLEGACRFLASRRLSRDALVVALGGGVAGDLAGLAASLYLRGVRFIQAPTSLLAMVDSSVGGKTALNIPEGKNLVGTVYQPEAVFADTLVLPTLPVREWYSGMAEVVKTALTLDPALLADLEKGGLAPGGLDPARIVAACCRRKAEVVAGDEREAGWRRVLNFGHTLAHALEAAGGYGRISHGEAVVEGMKAALVLSRSLAALPSADFERARRVLRLFPAPPAPFFPGGAGGRGGDELLPYLARDKKAREGKVVAVLLSAIGRPLFLPLADPALLVRSWEEWERNQGD